VETETLLTMEVQIAEITRLSFVPLTVQLLHTLAAGSALLEHCAMRVLFSSHF